LGRLDGNGQGPGFGEAHGRIVATKLKPTREVLIGSWCGLAAVRVVPDLPLWMSVAVVGSGSRLPFAQRGSTGAAVSDLRAFAVELDGERDRRANRE
jgi:hypothetical protein